ncbi:hypothetical protein [Actinoplanes sp. NPDC049802]|uniref:hypothetical protein n=1 Tax=Actinoplanes sp. NPDC049802 TaxID=3154742 RepID=UPI00340E20AC
MTYPSSARPGPRPGPPPGGFRPGPPAGGHPGSGSGSGTGYPGAGSGEDTGHPAVDAVLRSLANAARLAPGEQIAEYEAAYQVLQETLAGIDR